jgi:hypothetical protein
MNHVVNVRVLLGVLVVLGTALIFGTGCGQGSDQGQQSSEQAQALEEEQQKNEELQEELEAQQEEEARQEEAAKQEELEQQIEDLEQQVEEQESEPQEGEPQQTDEPESGSDSPDVAIESNSDWTAPPSQAPQGVVVVAPDYDVGAVTTEEAEVLDAAIGYYQYVEIGDYYATHSLLSTDDQALYPVDAWVSANTTLDSEAGEFVVTDAYPEDIGTGYPAYAVTVAVYLTDGSSSLRKTYFTDEGNGYWAHWLTQEEMNLFNSAL